MRHPASSHISHVHLGYSVVIMRSATIFSRSIIQQQRLAYSFNTFTNTSFDAQNIVSELLPSPKSYHGAHLLTSCTRMPAERKGDRFQRLHIDQGPTEYEPHCRSWYNHVRRWPSQSVMANSSQSPQFCSQILPRGGHVGRLVHRFLPSIRTLGVVDW
jgi:hypothetical protein